MSFYIICCFFVIQIIIQNEVLGQSNERDDLLEWYYKQSKRSIQNPDFPRLKRSISQKNRIARQLDNNYDYNDNNDDPDDWYVFDRVDEPVITNNARSFQISSQNNPNQINQNNRRPWLNTPPNTFVSTTTPQPAIPNAGPPRLPPCEENCNARTTSEYNPVCGTNGVTYFNNARFECALFCGRNIGLKNRGRCGPLLPRI